MTHRTKHLLSGLCLVVFTLLATSSGMFKGMKNNTFGKFNTNNIVEDTTDKRNYLVMADGAKMYGNKITWKSNLLGKPQVTIDDNKYKVDEVKAYMDNGVYYLKREGKTIFMRRIIHGKINVYVAWESRTSHYTDKYGIHETTYTVELNLFQKGGDDEKVWYMTAQKNIEDAVRDCPIALEMIQKEPKEMRELVKKDKNYLNEIIETYNNNCKPVVRPVESKKKK